MTVSVRTARAADASALIDFWLVAAEDAHRAADTPAAIRTVIERDPGALLLAIDGERIVGSVIAGWDGWRAHIYRLAVAPERRREGIGRLLLATAEARLAPLGAARADAMVLDDNSLAHRTWTAAGYRRQSEWARWVKPLF